MPENENRPITSQFFRPAAQVVSEAFENGALVLRLSDQHLIELNSIASAILAKSDGRHSVTQVAASLADAYEIPQTEAFQDTISLYNQLLLQGIVEPVDSVKKDNLSIEQLSGDDLLYIQNPDVLQQFDEENGLLFIRDTNRVKFVNSTGMLCWKLCDGDHCLAAITAELQPSTSEMPAVILEADVRKFFSDLVKIDFIRITSRRTGRDNKIPFNSSDKKA